MAKSSYEVEKEFLEKIQKITGKTLQEWMEIFNKRGFSKRNEVLYWLKTEHGFGHVNASLLGGVYVNNGRPVYADSNELLDNQFKNREQLRALFDYLIEMIRNEFDGVAIIPKKTYVSISGKREFAAIAIKSKEIRLGMDLGDMAFNEEITPSKSLGAMPRISHMLFLTEKEQLNKKVVGCLHTANNRVNS